MDELEILNKFTSFNEFKNRIWTESDVLKAIAFASKERKITTIEAEYELTKKGYSVIKTEILQEMKALIPKEDYKMEFDS